MAMALVATACSRDGASTGPTNILGKDFAANLRLVSGDQQLAALGAPLSQPIVVKVVDAGGNPVQGATVTFSVRAGGGSINPAANVSDGQGIVSSVWILGTSLGPNRAVAILTNSFVLDSTVFTATATVGAAQSLSKVSGDSQTTRAGSVLGALLVVRVRDSFGNNLSGVRITWTPGNLSGSVSFVADTTSADGTAAASWRLGNTATTQSLVASVAGLSAVGFTATATADTGRAITPVTGAGQQASVSSALPTTLSIRVTDQLGNPIAGVPITWNDSVGGGGSVSPTTSISSVTGMASTTWTLGVRAGQQSMRARLTGRPETVTYLATATVAFSDVVAGNFQACGVVASNGNAYCWGAGDAGQLGRGVTQGISTPTTPVSTSPDSVAGPFLQVRQITGGRNTFCSLSIARQMFCWGRLIGQSGVTSSVAILNTIVDPRQQILPSSIASGLEHVCVTDLAGLAFCTGTNFSGQLGDGSTTSPNVGTYSFVGPGVVGPPPGPGPQRYSMLAAGTQHTCGFRQFNPALLANNLVPECWGLNATGQVGDGAFANNPSPTFVSFPTVPATPPFPFDTTSLALGAQHTCALTPAGAAWCWGSNGFGQLGKGGTLSSVARDSVMQAVAMPTGVTFSKIYAGEFNTCAIATTGGAAYCWGRNDYGQTNGNPGAPATAPQLVPGSLVWRSLSIGELFICGVAGGGPGLAPPAFNPASPSQSPGTVWCWGDNLFGQIGQGTTGNNTPILQPVKVRFQP